MCSGDRKMKSLLGSILLLSLIGAVTLASGARSFGTKSTTIVVPDDFLTIQQAINNAAEGDTIFVRNGTYNEHVVVNKTVSLVGEGSDLAVIDAKGSGRVLSISQGYVNITGLTITGSGSTYAQDAAIWIEGEGHCNIFGNNVTENGFFGISVWDSPSNSIIGNVITKTKMMGIHVRASSDNMISGNKIEDYYCGISMHVSSNSNRIEGNIIRHGDCGVMLDNSHSNVISGNNITENQWKYGYNITYEKYGLSLQDGSSGNIIFENYIAENDGNGTQVISRAANNRFYHNTFVSNQDQAYASAEFANCWDDGYPSGGNYWADYNGTDANLDGIGDTAYVIDSNNIDNYPLMTQFDIPELPPSLMLPIFFALSLSAVIVCERKDFCSPES